MDFNDCFKTAVLILLGVVKGVLEFWVMEPIVVCHVSDMWHLVAL